jgi:hypothetical protein
VPHRIDQRLAPLAAAVRVDRSFEPSWDLLRFGLFKGLTPEEAALSSAHGAAVAHWRGLRAPQGAQPRRRVRDPARRIEMKSPPKRAVYLLAGRLPWAAHD